MEEILELNILKNNKPYIQLFFTSIGKIEEYLKDYGLPLHMIDSCIDCYFNGEAYLYEKNNIEYFIEINTRELD